MRYQLPFLIVCLFVFPLSAQAELLERKLDVSFQQTLLRDALTEIAQKGHFEWSYNTSIINGQQRVNLQAEQWTLREILYHLLGDGYTFKSNGNYLIIKKARKAPDEVYGYVKNPKTGERVAGVTIFDKKTLRATTTDSNGYYSLKVKKSSELVVSKLDWRDTVLSVNSQQQRFVDIPLEYTLPDTARKTPDFEDDLMAQLDEMNTELVRLFNATRNKWHERNLRDSLVRVWQVSFLPKIGTNHTLSGQVINDYSFNILAGYSKAVRRLEVGGLGNFTQESVHGAQIGGVFNHNRGNTNGLQVGGVYNLTGDTLSGMQVGGLCSVAGFSRTGLQISGISNFIGSGNGVVQVGGVFNQIQGNTHGTQIAGLYNLTAGELKGLQVAGLLNWAHTPNHSFQCSGLINLAGSGATNLQAAGVFNNAQNLNGVQVSGLVNHASWVKGVQVGVVNSANDCNCLQVGLINRIGHRWMPLINWKGKRKR